MAKNDQKRGEIIPFMTPPGIAMYPWVFEPNPEPDDQGVIWYQIMLKFPKKDVDEGGKHADDFKDMRRAFMAAAKQGIELGVYDFRSMDDKPAEFGSPLRDGDKFNKANNKKRNEELFGHWFMNIKSKEPPEVVDAENALKIITSRRDFYPGASAVVSGVTGPYNTKGNEGVYTRLTNVCKIADGDRIGGKPAAKGQFEKYAKNAPKRNASDDGDDLL